ncbi:hypothetical protein JW872_02410 [Candidatus Babeliales bacterium]|nr:hypothetical protein [Candidatus Babeliales bacterium]
MAQSFLSYWWGEYRKVPYYQELLIGGLAVILGLGGSYWYRSMVSARELKAHKAFTECYEVYEQAALAQYAEKDDKKAEQLWEEAELAFRTGYQQNTRSYLGPYFLAFESETLARRGLLDKAIESLDEFLSKISSSSKLYGPYAVKRALMKMDSPDVAVKQAGLDELQDESRNVQNMHRDVALYFLGQYYTSIGESDKARGAWDEIADIGSAQDKTTQSPWMQLVKPLTA